MALKVTLLGAGRKVRSEIPNEAATLATIGDRLVKLGNALKSAECIGPREFKDRGVDDSVLYLTLISLHERKQFPVTLLVKREVDPDDLFSAAASPIPSGGD